MENFTLRQPSDESREQRIREVFHSLGGASLSETARACIGLGIWASDELEAMQVRAARTSVQHALKVKDDQGLPFAGPTTQEAEDGAPLWRQRRFWGFPDYSLNVGELIDQRNERHQMALALAEECEARYGKKPEILPLAEGERAFSGDD